jgi:hypothetical protein
MKLSLASIALVAGLLGSSAVYAQAPAAAATGTTALCNDGSYTSTATKRGACRGHQGVKDWYGPAATATPAAAASPANPVAAETKSAGSAASAAVAAGGGPGLVWVNPDSKIYHCPKTEFYGKTKQGSYMTEAAAKAAGNRAARGKSCSS